jgi:K(+)-stimulated pyrophosphate-energized sodium pump
MSVVALVIAPSIALSSDTMMVYNDTKTVTEVVSEQMERSVEVSINNNEDGTSKAVVVTTVIENGEKSVSEQVFEGTEEEVKAKVTAYNQSSTDVKVQIENVAKEVKKEMN